MYPTYSYLFLHFVSVLYLRCLQGGKNHQQAVDEVSVLYLRLYGSAMLHLSTGPISFCPLFEIVERYVGEGKVAEHLEFLSSI